MLKRFGLVLTYVHKMDKDAVVNTISLWIKEKKWKLDPQTPLLQLPDVWQSLRPSIAHFAGQLFNSPNLLSVPTPSHAMLPMEVEQDADSRQDPESESPISPATDAFIDNWAPFFAGDHNSSQCPAIRVHSSEDSPTHRMSEDDLQRSIEIIHNPDKLVQESHQRLGTPRNDFNNGPSGSYLIFPTSTSWGLPPYPEIQISNLEAPDGFEMVASPVDDARCGKCFRSDDASVLLMFVERKGSIQTWRGCTFHSGVTSSHRILYVLHWIPFVRPQCHHHPLMVARCLRHHAPPFRP